MRKQTRLTTLASGTNPAGNTAIWPGGCRRLDCWQPAAAVRRKIGRADAVQTVKRCW